MFSMYAILGAWVPLFTVRLKELGFTPWDIALASATGALSYLAAPVLAGQMADRWFAAERCLLVGGLATGSLLWLLAGLEDASAVFWACLAFWAIMVPVTTITNALILSHLAHPARHFGKIRMWGTVGWVFPNWLLGLWWWLGEQPWWEALGWPEPSSANIFHLGALLAWGLALYTLTVPHTPPRRERQSWLAPLQALQMVRQRGIATYLLASVLVYITIPFNTQLTPLLLESLGIGRTQLAPLLTIAQSMEIVLLALLPLLLGRLGMRTTMLLGLTTWTAGLAVFALGQPSWLVMAGLVCNGVFIACFVVAGQLFLNSRATGAIRASTQSLLVFVNGIGLLCGNLLAGGIRHVTEPGFGPTYWTAVAIGLVAVVFFRAGFATQEGRAAAPELAISCTEPAQNLQ